MIEMENMLVMLVNIVVKLVKEMMYNQFDCLMVYKLVNLENIEEMLVNMLVMLENTLVMHYFHHDHLENMLVMLDLNIHFLFYQIILLLNKIYYMLEMLDCMKVLMDLMGIVVNKLVMLDLKLFFKIHLFH